MVSLRALSPTLDQRGMDTWPRAGLGDGLGRVVDDPADVSGADWGEGVREFLCFGECLVKVGVGHLAGHAGVPVVFAAVFAPDHGDH